MAACAVTYALMRWNGVFEHRLLVVSLLVACAVQGTTFVQLARDRARVRVYTRHEPERLLFFLPRKAELAKAIAHERTQSLSWCAPQPKPR
jgi:hypothetical protein